MQCNKIIAEWVNIGTLLAFVIVCRRRADHARDRPGNAPATSRPDVPLISVLGILFCLLLMFSLWIIGCALSRGS